MSRPESISYRMTRRFLQHKLAVGSLLTLLLLGLLSIGAPLVEAMLGLDGEATNLFQRNKPPSPEHPLGTDEIGRDLLAFEGPREAWRRTLVQAEINLSDLDFVETHDCFTIAELMEYEAMGLTAQGRGAQAILEGWTQRDGKLPVNPSGGLKAKGHPIGATGVSMHVMTAMQLTGSAGDMQLEQPQMAGIFNMGGMAVANYCAILEPLK